MPFVTGHKPTKRHPISDDVKRIEQNIKGAGRIENKAQLKHILANANRGDCAERNIALICLLFGSLTRITELVIFKLKTFLQSQVNLNLYSE